MTPPRSPAAAPIPLIAGFAGWAAMFTGLGLARFAYTPLLPALVEAGWFTPGGAAAHGAANLAGYLLGAALAFPLARRVRVPVLLRLAMAASGLALAWCAIAPALLPAGGLLFGLARMLAGGAGGVLMVLGPPSVLAVIPAARRGRIGGLVFAGVGSGIAASAILLPWLVALGLPAAWLGLAGAALVLAAVTWPLWPPAGPPPPPSAPVPGLAALIGGYALNGVGIVPHMLLLADFVARGLAEGIATGALAFAAYGLGAAIGPLAGGALADRFGFRATLGAAIRLQAAAILAPALLPALPAAVLSGIVVGALTPGVPPLVLGRAVELAGPEAARRAWARATIGYATFQGAAAWAVAALFGATGLYWPLFVAGAAAALASGFVMERTPRPPPG